MRRSCSRFSPAWLRPAPRCCGAASITMSSRRPRGPTPMARGGTAWRSAPRLVPPLSIQARESSRELRQQRSSMRVEWYGQSAFHLSAGERTVAIDPFADMSAMAASRGMQFDYPPIEGGKAELLLVTHEHIDHNGVEAIGEVDLLILPVGGGPTIGAEQAAAIVERLSPRWVVPMHYRTPRIGFLETADAFLERSAHVERLAQSSFETSELPASDEIGRASCREKG